MIAAVFGSELYWPWTLSASTDAKTIYSSDRLGGAIRWIEIQYRTRKLNLLITCFLNHGEDKNELFIPHKCHGRGGKCTKNESGSSGHWWKMCRMNAFDLNWYSQNGTFLFFNWIYNKIKQIFIHVWIFFPGNRAKKTFQTNWTDALYRFFFW